MNRYDVVVAGAGPAGSTAARALARSGASVLMLDKQKFPRDKPCGGGVTLRAASVQDVDLSPVIERTIYGARISLRLGESFDRRYREPLTYMTQRCRLDALLAERAAESGADFHDGEGIRAIDVGGSGFNLTPVRITTDRDAYTARIFIGADGANGPSGRLLGLRPRFEEAVAFEGNLPYSADILEEWRDYAALDFGGLAGGYAWVFPKAEHLNVGVGAWKYAGFTLRPKLAELCRRYGFDPAALEGVRGYHLPIRIPSPNDVGLGSIAVAGDAAGLVDPLTGEGIHMAFESGRLVVDSALAVLRGEARSMTHYQRAVEHHLQPELEISRKLQELFTFAPPPYLALLRRSHKAWHFVCRLIRGDITYLDFMRAIGPVVYALDFFSTIARRRRESRVAALTPLLKGT